MTAKLTGNERLMELEEVQELALSVLDELDAFCKAHDIPYYLIGGSLIGAVRSKDLVPWDDDIDVAMKREDYARFCKEYVDSEKFKLFTYDRVDGYCLMMAKLADTSTIFDDVYARESTYGVFVDIFPLDEIDDYKGLRARWIRLKFMLFHYAYFISADGIKDNLLKTVIRIVLTATLGRIPYRKTAARFEASVAKDKGKYLMNYWGNWGLAEHALKECFDGTTPVPLRDRSYPAPVGYDTWLTTIYGDYMREPTDPPQYHGHAYELPVENGGSGQEAAG